MLKGKLKGHFLGDTRQLERRYFKDDYQILVTGLGIECHPPVVDVRCGVVCKHVMYHSGCRCLHNQPGNVHNVCIIIEHGAHRYNCYPGHHGSSLTYNILSHHNSAPRQSHVMYYSTVSTFLGQIITSFEQQHKRKVKFLRQNVG